MVQTSGVYGSSGQFTNWCWTERQYTKCCLPLTKHCYDHDWVWFIKIKAIDTYVHRIMKILQAGFGPGYRPLFLYVPHLWLGRYENDDPYPGPWSVHKSSKCPMYIKAVKGNCDPSMYIKAFKGNFDSLMYLNAF